MSDYLQADISALKRERQKSLFVKCSIVFACLYLLLAWNAQNILADNAIGLFPTFEQSQIDSINFVERVVDLAKEIVPYPIRQDGQLLGVFNWTWSLLSDHAVAAVLFTLAIALMSVLLSASLAYSIALLDKVARLYVSQGDMTEKSYIGTILKQLIGLLLKSLAVLLIFMRAIPDLIWAYIFLSILGPSCWTAVIALTIHNTGILARIGQDIIRNARYPSLAPLQNAAVSNRLLVVLSILPEIFSKLLIHVFYRWETCFRDAVVVGMVGLPTLGFWIFQDAWPKFRYDEMLFYTVISVVVIYFIEYLSQSSRRHLKLK